MIITNAKIVPPGVEVTLIQETGAGDYDRQGVTTVSSYKAQVVAEWEDGTSSVALSYYNDELRFRKEEFIGKTQEQVDDLFHKKDVAYLQS